MTTAPLTMAALVARHVRPRIVLPAPPPRPQMLAKVPARLPVITSRSDGGDAFTVLLNGAPVASVRPEEGGWRVRNLGAHADRRLDTRMEALALAHRIARMLAA